VGKKSIRVDKDQKIVKLTGVCRGGGNEGDFGGKIEGQAERGTA